jgi:hypothetical protein
MLVVLGLLILLAAVIFGFAGVLGNSGSEHAVTNGFSVLGITVSGSTGTVFLIGIVVGLVAAVGLALLLTGARRTAVRGNTARHDLKESRRQTAAVSEERDALVDERYADHHEPPSTTDQ